MRHETRNNSVGGIVMLVGAALVGFGTTQPWARISGTLPVGRLAGLSAGQNLDFGHLLAPGGAGGSVTSLLFGSAAFTAGVGGALIFTRTPGLGILWRLLAFLGVAAGGIVGFLAWSVVNDPTSVLTGGGSSTGAQVIRVLGNLLQDANVLSFEPQLGLWLLTIGSAVIALGACIPGMRRTTYDPLPGAGPYAFQPMAGPPLAPPAGAGWYPDPLNPSVLRWFDGARWTPTLRPRG